MKKAWVQVQEGSTYEDLAPSTVVDSVFMDEQGKVSLRTKLDALDASINELKTKVAGGGNEYEPAKMIVSSSEPDKAKNTIWIKP